LLLGAVNVNIRPGPPPPKKNLATPLHTGTWALWVANPKSGTGSRCKNRRSALYTRH